MLSWTRIVEVNIERSKRLFYISQANLSTANNITSLRQVTFIFLHCGPIDISKNLESFLHSN